MQAGVHHPLALVLGQGRRRQVVELGHQFFLGHGILRIALGEIYPGRMSLTCPRPDLDDCRPAIRIDLSQLCVPNQGNPPDDSPNLAFPRANSFKNHESLLETGENGLTVASW